MPFVVFTSQDSHVSPMTIDAFTAFVKAENQKYLAIIKQPGVKPEKKSSIRGSTLADAGLRA